MKLVPQPKKFTSTQGTQVHIIKMRVDTPNLQNIVIAQYMSLLSTPTTMEGLYYVKFFIRKFNISLAT